MSSIATRQTGTTLKIEDETVSWSELHDRMEDLLRSRESLEGNEIRLVIQRCVVDLMRESEQKQITWKLSEAPFTRVREIQLLDCEFSSNKGSPMLIDLPHEHQIQIGLADIAEFNDWDFVTDPTPSSSASLTSSLLSLAWTQWLQWRRWSPWTSAFTPQNKSITEEVTTDKVVVGENTDHKKLKIKFSRVWGGGPSITLRVPTSSSTRIKLSRCSHGTLHCSFLSPSDHALIMKSCHSLDGVVRHLKHVTTKDNALCSILLTDCGECSLHL